MFVIHEVAAVSHEMSTGVESSTAVAGRLVHSGDRSLLGFHAVSSWQLFGKMSGGELLHPGQWKFSGYPCRSNTEITGRNPPMISRIQVGPISALGNVRTDS